jgi:hypothetical protein
MVFGTARTYHLNSGPSRGNNGSGQGVIADQPAGRGSVVGPQPAPVAARRLPAGRRARLSRRTRRNRIAAPRGIGV